MRIFFFCVILFGIGNLSAQDSTMSDEEMAVKAVVLEVFDAMRATDSVRLKKCFAEKVDVYTSFTSRDGDPKLMDDDIQQFITSVGTPHPGLYDEKLGAYEIKVDDNLASIWVDYYFFVDDKFSHCGVDYFQLFNDGTSWKIFFLADTRRKKTCELPDATELW